MSLITYNIVADHKGKLRESAKLACSFWNKYISPKNNIVIRLGKFTSFGNTIARAYMPYWRDNTAYGVIEFNTEYIDKFNDIDITSTIIHEIGHTLGIGWDKWMNLFSHSSGKFYKKWINKLPDLSKMLVETEYGPGTTLAHWDEDSFEKELMSGFKSGDEYILPVTIDVMSLLGHFVIERITTKTRMEDLVKSLRGVVFSRKDEIDQIRRDLYVETEIWEEVYDNSKTPL